MIAQKKQKLLPLLKYPGGKEKELGHILPNLPLQANKYFEPFVGGGAVYFALDAEHYFINDKSQELIAVYQMVKSQNEEFFFKLEQIDHNWKVIEEVVQNHSKEIINIYNLYKSNRIDKIQLQDMMSEFVMRNASGFNGMMSPTFNVGIHNFVTELTRSFNNKLIRAAELEKNRGALSEMDLLLNIECAFKAAFYMHFRFLYNHSSDLHLTQAFRAAIFFFIREYCYSSMYRYNGNGEFNVPYGGISYNKKRLGRKIELLKQTAYLKQLEKTTIGSEDFYSFLQKNQPEQDDFMFIDPPYDTEFSTYAKNLFNKADQMRLADYLRNECECYFMLIIKNTDFIFNLYNNTRDRCGRQLRILSFDKRYLVSFLNRNKKDAKHLLITNY